MTAEMASLAIDDKIIDLTDDEPPQSVLETPLQPAPPSALAEPGSAEQATEDVAGHPHPPHPPELHLPADEGEELADASADEQDAWEGDSVISDIVHSMTSEESNGSSGVVGSGENGSAQKAHKRAELIKLLHEQGPHEFVFQMLESETYTAKGLCEALGGRIDLGIDDLPEDHVIYYRALGKIIRRELSKRNKLDAYTTVDDAVELLKTSKNILVLTGAGISTSLGIPDFRSKDGLYNMLRDSPLAEFVDDPQDVFALDIFLENPSIFFTVARSILSPVQKFSPTHSFIKLLQDRGQLLTNYTQNIDNFEACAGIDSKKLVHCHGSFATATCIKCRTRVPGSEIEEDIGAGRIPRCKACLENLARQRLSVGPSGMKRKRSWNEGAQKRSKNRQRDEWDDDNNEDDEDEDDDLEDLSDEAAGVMKPDIVFFGEDLPQHFHERLSGRDKDVVDLVVVMGTSLMVAPVSEVPGFLPPSVPQIYISREPCHHINFDISLLGDCDVVVAELCRRAGWDLRHDMIPPADENPVDVRQADGLPHRHRFTRVADLPPASEACDQVDEGAAAAAGGLDDESDNEAKTAGEWDF